MAETTDDLVLAFLRGAGVAIPESINSLGELDTDVFVAACAHCLNMIAQDKGEERRLPAKLPSNPGARFRSCTALAAAISSLGFDGEVGFNQFLYPSEKETRMILLFLIDQMPKADDGDGDGDAGGLGGMSFDDQVRQALMRGLEQPWTPPTWSAKRPMPAERAAYLRAVLARSALAAAKRAERQAAIEERLTGGATADGSRSGGFGDRDWVRPSGSSSTVVHGAGGLIAHAAMFAHESSVNEVAATDTAAATETAAERAERAERDKLRQVREELERITAAIEEQKKLHDAAREAEAALAAATRQGEAEVAREESEAEKRAASHASRAKALELAVDPEGSRARLQKASAASAAALMTLAEEWEAHRAPLLQQIREAQRARQLRKEGAVTKMAQVKQLRVEMKQMVGDLGDRDETIARLTKELAKAKGAARSTYTDRIMDVVRNLRKQKLGIEKILADIRESQKEVNRLSETVQRSFAATDEIVFRDASQAKSAASKQCYKAVAAMHDAFGRLVENVQEIENHNAANGDLQGRVSELAARNTAEAIERITADLKEMKAENQKLEEARAASAG